MKKLGFQKKLGLQKPVVWKTDGVQKTMVCKKQCFAKTDGLQKPVICKKSGLQKNVVCKKLGLQKKLCLQKKSGLQKTWPTCWGSWQLAQELGSFRQGHNRIRGTPGCENYFDLIFGTLSLFLVSMWSLKPKITLMSEVSMQKLCTQAVVIIPLLPCLSFSWSKQDDDDNNEAGEIDNDNNDQDKAPGPALCTLNRGDVHPCTGQTSLTIVHISTMFTINSY